MTPSELAQQSQTEYLKEMCRKLAFRLELLKFYCTPELIQRYEKAVGIFNLDPDITAEKAIEKINALNQVPLFDENQLKKVNS